MKNLLSSRRWQLKYPEKYQAQRAAQKAIRNGVLVRKPCEKCSNPKVHAHHDDYSKPLEIRWLCSKCHGEIHNNELKRHYESNKNPLIPKAIELRESKLSYGKISKILNISRSQVFKWINNPNYK